MSKNRKHAQAGQSYPSRPTLKLSVPAKLTPEEARNGEYVTTAEVAKMLRVSISAVQNWRARGTGPQCFRAPGKRVNLYCREDVREFVHTDGRSTIWRNRTASLARNPQLAEIAEWLEENQRLVAVDVAQEVV
jgi:hypothetical protein